MTETPKNDCQDESLTKNQIDFDLAVISERMDGTINGGWTAVPVDYKAMRRIIREIASLRQSLKEAETHGLDLETELGKLREPAAVHANMLKGLIAKITLRQCAHTHGEAEVAKLNTGEQVIAAAMSLAEAMTEFEGDEEDDPSRCGERMDALWAACGRHREAMEGE